MSARSRVGLLWVGGTLLAWTAAFVPAGGARSEPEAAPIADEPGPRLPVQGVEAEAPARAAPPPDQDERAQRFALEREDVGWKQEMTAALLGQLAASGIAEHSLQRVDCRATLCRVEVKVESPAQLSALARRTVELPASQVSVVSTEQMADGIFASLFLARSAD